MSMLARCGRRFALATLLALGGFASTVNTFAQSTAGQPEPPGGYPSLFVINAKGVTLSASVLILIGVAPSVIVFADRPVRAADYVPTKSLVADWGVGDESFEKIPPNATVTAFSVGSVDLKDVVVVLKDPKLEGDNLSFQVDVLEGDLEGADGPAAVFVDRVKHPTQF